MNGEFSWRSKYWSILNQIPMLLCIHFTLIQRFKFSDFTMILTSVSSWLRNQLKAPKIMSFSRIRKLRALLWTGLSACAPPRPISKQTRVPKRHTPQSLDPNFLIFGSVVPQTIQDSSRSGLSVSRSIQKVYMFIPLHRAPTGPNLKW